MARSFIRKPSLKKSFSARTKGKATRSIKKVVKPFYGKKGSGFAHPKRAVYNKVYHRTSASMFSLSSAFSKYNFAGAVGGGCLIQCVVFTCQLMWYAIVLAFWLMYAMGYGIYRGVLWLIDTIRATRQQKYYDDIQDEQQQ